VLQQIEREQASVEVVPVQLVADAQTDESELDQMLSFVEKKVNQRWLWHLKRPCNWESVGGSARRPYKRRISQTEKLTRAIWNQPILHGWLGSLSTSFRFKSASSLSSESSDN